MRADSRSLEQAKPRSVSKLHTILFESFKATCPALMQSTGRLEGREKTMVYSQEHSH